MFECFLETAKIAFKGRKIKFNYILNDGSNLLVEIDGDEFAECDYGIVVDNSNGMQELNQKLDMLAQAGLQNGMSFSTIMKLYTTTSLAEKQRLVEADENRKIEQQQQQQQQEYELRQQELQAKLQAEQQKREMEYQMHQEDNEMKILIAQINSQAEADRLAIINHEDGLTKGQELELEKEKLSQSAKEFEQKLALEKEKHKDEVRLKEKQIAKGTSRS